MLNLTKKVGETIQIGDARIVIKQVGRNDVLLGIEAPAEIRIIRNATPLVATPPNPPVCQPPDAPLQCAQHTPQ